MDMDSESRRQVLRGVLALAGLGLLSGCGVQGQAGPPAKLPRIGYLMIARTSAVDAFLEGMRDHGYVEGDNVAIEWRSAEGQYERLPALAQELANLKVDVIIAATTPQLRAAQQATRTIPIVFASVADPVGEGYVQSMNRPGGNITGLANVATETTGKRLELLREAVPGLMRVGVLINPTTNTMGPTETAARQLGLQLRVAEVQGPGELEEAIGTLAADGVGAIFIVQDPMFYIERERIASLFTRYRLPAMATHKEDAEAGVLMSYGETVDDTFRRLAAHTVKVLKGASPAELPVDRLARLGLVVNLTTARTIGLAIPQSVLAEATIIQ
jgi:putative ABC transport system substrate-binding protein